MSASVITLSLLAILASPHKNYSVEMPSPTRTAVVCMKTGEQSSGQNKICYYNCLGSEAAITISALAFCPFSITR